MAGEPVVDMQWGVYRKVYSGFIWGDRLNGVSMEAEAWFWRIHAVADDLGNCSAEWSRLAVEAGGKRRISADKAKALTDELVAARLVNKYRHGQDEYLHIRGFEERQPANKNGRRIQRHPKHPPETEGMVCLGNPTEPDSNCRESKSPNPSPSPNPIPNPSPSPTPGISLTPADRFIADRKVRSGDNPPGFVAAMDAYPAHRAMNRADARVAWDASGAEAESAAVVAGIEAWKASREWGDGVIPNAERFFANHQWRVPPPTIKGKGEGFITADDAVSRFRARQAAKAAKEGA